MKIVCNCFLLNIIFHNLQFLQFFFQFLQFLHQKLLNHLKFHSDYYIVQEAVTKNKTNAGIYLHPEFVNNLKKKKVSMVSSPSFSKFWKSRFWFLNEKHLISLITRLTSQDRKKYEKWESQKHIFYCLENCSKWNFKNQTRRREMLEAFH